MSKIEWTEQTWNPVTGCIKVSAGCKHCYAETMAKRLNAMGAIGYDNGFELSIMPSRLNQPLKRKKSTTYFVNSMSDLFQEGVPDDFINQVFDIIKRTPQHRYQLLTKRAERLPLYFKDKIIPDNVWLGVTVENIKEGLPRIDLLRQVKASSRFLSIEPLLEDLGAIDLTDIHWVIVGGESGPKARQMDEKWVKNIKAQCDDQNVPFFFKQWGAYGEDGIKRSKHENGRKLLNRTWDAMPEKMKQKELALIPKYSGAQPIGY